MAKHPLKPFPPSNSPGTRPPARGTAHLWRCLRGHICAALARFRPPWRPFPARMRHLTWLLAHEGRAPRRRKCGNQSSSLQSAGPATRSAGAMDTTGRIFGAAATKHFESASTSERNQRAAEQRVRVAASPLIYLCGHGGGESGTMGDPSEFHLRRCSRRRAS